MFNIHLPDWAKGLVGGGGLAAIVGAVKSHRERADHKDEYSRSQTLLELKALADTAVAQSANALARAEAAEAHCDALETAIKSQAADFTKRLDAKDRTIRDQTKKISSQAAEIVKLRADVDGLTATKFSQQSEIDHLRAELGQAKMIASEVETIHAAETNPSRAK